MTAQQNIKLGASDTPIERLSLGWWGMMSVIATEAALFSYLLFTFYYSAAQIPEDWIPAQPSLRLALPNTLVLIASSIAVYWGESGGRAGSRGREIGGLVIAIVLGIVFVVVQLFEWNGKPYSLNSGLYGSLYFTVTGFHMAHVLVGLFLLMGVLLWTARDLLNGKRFAPIPIAAIYWHFVDLVWLAVFFTFYLLPLFV